MASIQRYPSVKHKRLWRVQYRDASGVSRTKSGFRTKAAASDWAAKNTASLRDGSWIAPEHRKKTVQHFHEVWQHTLVDKRASTVDAYQASWRTHIESHWGSYQVGAISRADIQSWATRLSSTASPSVVRRAVYILSAILSEAVDSGALAVNPASGVKLPKVSNSPGEALTSEQVASLVGAVEDESIKALIMILVYTGIRWGEAAALRVSDIDTESRRITISRSAVLVSGQYIIGQPKSGKTRTVTYPLGLMEVVEGVIAGRSGRVLLFPLSPGNTQPLSQRAVWRNAVAACHEADNEFPKGLRVHDLRHTAASLLIDSGASVLVVQRQLGHASPSITLDVYSHLLGDTSTEVVDSMRVIKP